MLVYYWIFVVFVFGIIVGSFLNVAISRLPAEKSLIWPGSRCGKCFHSVRWYDNFPLVSYIWLRGRCRVCGHRFSIRYFLVELLTGLGFAGLFYIEVVYNIHGWPTGVMAQHGFFAWQSWAAFGFHALLFSFLLAAAFCDLDRREIPLPLTLTGTAAGLALSVLLPWPFPHAPTNAVPQAAFNQNPNVVWANPATKIGTGAQVWPVWGPLPKPLQPGGNWQTGLATGVAGMLIGTFLMRAVAFLFGAGLGREALGLGDADLMMMAGAFLGWQAVCVAFFVSVVPALFFGLYGLVMHGDNSLPFGPSLAMGVMGTLLLWGWIGAYVQPLFFSQSLILLVAVVAGAFMLLSSLLIRMLRQ